jgi:hypothetical protein
MNLGRGGGGGLNGVYFWEDSRPLLGMPQLLVQTDALLITSEYLINLWNHSLHVVGMKKCLPDQFLTSKHGLQMTDSSRWSTPAGLHKSPQVSLNQRQSHGNFLLRHMKTSYISQNELPEPDPHIHKYLSPNCDAGLPETSSIISLTGQNHINNCHNI